MRSIIQSIVALIIGLAVLTACASSQEAQTAPTNEPAAVPPSEQATNEEVTPLPVAGNEALWAQLREDAGLVVLLRHADTVAGTGDPPGFRLDDCATQRNLSDAGREQATQIGNVFRMQRIPIHQVLSSQYCRCLETAELMNVGSVEPSPMLNSFFEDRTSQAAQTEQVRQQILAHRDRAGVIIMVTHMVNIGAVSGVSPRPGEAVIVRGSAAGEIDVVGRLAEIQTLSK